MKKYLRIVCTIIILLMVFQFTGCKKNQKKPTSQKKPSVSQKMSTPKELTKIEQDIETIIKEGQKLQNAQKAGQSSSVTTVAPQIKQSFNKKSQQCVQKSGQNSKPSQPKEPPEKKSWNTIDKTVKDIHTNWNVLIPTATKAGANSNLINNVSTAINTLTTNSNNKSINDTLIAANNVYKYIPDIETLFKAELTPDIKRLRYYNRDIAFNASTGKWDIAKKDIADLNTTWKTLKVKLTNEAKSSADKFDAGLAELEKSVNSKDSTITKVKSDVLETDIKSLEKASKSKK
ncbi:hypothetical protein [Thermoanaerobacterium sp. RBIITD]|uniref:hypothetical protein n=1 Tax=Thermoanaerobacterium sp. RBIITD TaxID=1550240 RepID=UPI000BB7242D|nr:hypothetical protein [Thermoanaerobacterium sp. RBIITD]SNX55094.1 hypothetical protein SAMN05660242_2884 [Thermoanaerobacterium sp. RBIITD]